MVRAGDGVGSTASAHLGRMAMVIDALSWLTGLLKPLCDGNSITMNAKQCKMARVGLGLSAAELADMAGVGYATVARFETGANLADESRSRLEAALSKAGAIFSSRSGRVGAMVPD